MGVALGGKWGLECGWVRAHCLGVGSPQGVEQNQVLYASNKNLQCNAADTQGVETATQDCVQSLVDVATGCAPVVLADGRGSLGSNESQPSSNASVDEAGAASRVGRGR